MTDAKKNEKPSEPVEVKAAEPETPAEPVTVAPEAEAAAEPVEFNPDEIEESEDDGTSRADGLNAEDEVEAK